MILSHIVAASENNVIGVDGGLPWDIPEDMKFFRDKTKGHAMIMGRKTFESLPKALPKRLNVVITRQQDYSPEGAVVFSNLNEAIEFCQTKTDEWGEEVFIIGGGEIYRQSLDVVDRIYLTRIHKKIEGDTKYPELPPNRFKEVERVDRNEPVPFSFLTFEKLK